MSLQDESFPADELFDHLNTTTASNIRSLPRQFSIHLELPEAEHFQDNESPFLNSDCSEETCASDPVGLEHDHEEAKNVSANNDNIENGHGHTNPQLGSARSSKAVSYQDIHSAYTKRRYKHVTSKVRKYIAEMDDKDQQRRNSSGAFQRHRSLPESLTPRGNADDQEKLDDFLSTANSSGTNTNTRDESYERVASEKDFWKSHADYLQSKLYKKIDEAILLRKNFDAIRNELTDYKEKLKRQSNLLGGSAGNSTIGHSLHSLMYYPTLVNEIESGKVAKGTQTDLPLTSAHISHLSDLSDMPAIAANATPHPNVNLNDITYDSSAGSIEIRLLSVRPAPRLMEPNQSTKMSGNIKPYSLNFSNDSAEVDANGNAIIIAEGDAGINSQARSSNRITTNNSGSSHPSSNDSAIEIEGHELRSPQPRYRGQTINFGPLGDWSQPRDIIYVDQNSNRIIEQIPLNQASAQATANSNIDSSNNTSTQSQSFGLMPYTVNPYTGRRKKSLAARMLRMLGPCAHCDDPNQTLDATNATYTVGVPLLGDESNRV